MDDSPSELHVLICKRNAFQEALIRIEARINELLTEERLAKKVEAADRPVPSQVRADVAAQRRETALRMKREGHSALAIAEALGVTVGRVYQMVRQAERIEDRMQNQRRPTPVRIAAQGQASRMEEFVSYRDWKAACVKS